MNKSFRVLLLAIMILFVYELKVNGISSPPNLLREFEGTWEFEKAEYMERFSYTGDYQVKYLIDKPEGLEALTGCFHQSVKRITITDVVYMECPYSFYCGRAIIITVQAPEGVKNLLTVGFDPEDLGKESPTPDVKFNVIGLTYWIEKVDDETIAMTLEAICTENAVETNAAVKCILKKIKF